MLDQSLTQIAQALRDGTISSTELTNLALEKDRANKQLNAFISLNESQALADANKADAALAAGNIDPLCGIVTAHKDIFCTKGILTSCGSKIFSNFVSPYDATVIEKTAARHMVSIGKTNMDEFAMGSTTESSFYGPVLNPWNTEHVPGGSSGGAAAAVSAGIVPVSTGTDTGGSVRQPAALCGLTGIKPTYAYSDAVQKMLQLCLSPCVALILRIRLPLKIRKSILQARLATISKACVLVCPDNISMQILMPISAIPYKQLPKSLKRWAQR
jgi:aspartyl-tRNA(Asn)/glutamyl-tRNA(Gln) amidotransferase subunit A